MAAGFLVILAGMVAKAGGTCRCGRTSPIACRLGTGKVNVPALLIGSVVLLGLLFTAFDESWAQATYISLAAGVMVLSIVVLTGLRGPAVARPVGAPGASALFAGRFVQAGLPIELAIPAGVALTS